MVRRPARTAAAVLAGRPTISRRSSVDKAPTLNASGGGGLGFPGTGSPLMPGGTMVRPGAG